LKNALVRIIAHRLQEADSHREKQEAPLPAAELQVADKFFSLPGATFFLSTLKPSVPIEAPPPQLPSVGAQFVHDIVFELLARSPVLLPPDGSGIASIFAAVPLPSSLPVPPKSVSAKQIPDRVPIFYAMVRFSVLTDRAVSVRIATATSDNHLPTQLLLTMWGKCYHRFILREAGQSVSRVI